MNVSGLAGFLLAKAAAAHSRRQDWYDVAFVLLHNDAGGPSAAAELVQDRFTDGAVATALNDLWANFEKTLPERVPVKETKGEDRQARTRAQDLHRPRQNGGLPRRKRSLSRC